MGQSASSGAFASKSLKLAVFGKSVSSGLDLGLSVRAVEATASAWERCLADCERNGLELLAAPKQVQISPLTVTLKAVSSRVMESMHPSAGWLSVMHRVKKYATNDPKIE